MHGFSRSLTQFCFDCIYYLSNYSVFTPKLVYILKFMMKVGQNGFDLLLDFIVCETFKPCHGQ